MKKKIRIQLEGLQNIKGCRYIYQIMLSMERMLRAITNYRVPLKLLIVNLMHSQVPGWTHLRVHQSVVAESWDSKGTPDFQHYKGVKGRARSLMIRLGRGTSRSSLNLHIKQITKWLVHIPRHLWVLGQATGTLDHKTHHGPDSGEATTFPHIVFSATLRWGYI